MTQDYKVSDTSIIVCRACQQTFGTEEVLFSGHTDQWYSDDEKVLHFFVDCPECGEQIVTFSVAFNEIVNMSIVGSRLDRIEHRLSNIMTDEEIADIEESLQEIKDGRINGLLNASTLSSMP